MKRLSKSRGSKTECILTFFETFLSSY